MGIAKEGGALMKTKMARVLNLAERNKPKIIIPCCCPMSIENLKIRIGEVLLCLLAGQAEPDGWRQLEKLLRFHWKVRPAPESCQTPLLSGVSTVESKESPQRVSK
jgi:hypothetical protein